MRGVTEVYATETFVALRMLGFGEHDRLAFRVVFLVERLRETTELAAALRIRAHESLQVRPIPLRLLCVPQWSVALTTPAMPLRLASLRSLEGEMQAVAQRHAGCRVVDLKPVLDAAATERMGAMGV
jgi:hypothetical protein